MARKPSPLTVALRDSITYHERHDLPMTADSVARLAANRLPLGECDPKALMLETLRHRAGPLMTREAKVITNERRQGDRKDYWICTPAELRAQGEIKTENRFRVAKQEKAFWASVEFLEEKERELGYPPYPELFIEDIQRIYRMNEVDPPSRSALAA